MCFLILIFTSADYREILEYWFWYCSDIPRYCWWWPSFWNVVTCWKKHCLCCKCQTTALSTSAYCCCLRCLWAGIPHRPGAPACSSCMVAACFCMSSLCHRGQVVSIMQELWPVLEADSRHSSYQQWLAYERHWLLIAGSCWVWTNQEAECHLTFMEESRLTCLENH